jgi:predicted lactoylglutathione lyase
METKIFVNLPVKNLEVTSTFFSKMGYKFDPQFSDEKAKCMIISDDIYVMLLVEPFFRSFTNKDIPDTAKTSGVILTLALNSKDEVDDLMRKCISAGGKDVSRGQETDFMYLKSFEDPDGHIWEIFHMDMAKVKQESKVQPA